MTRQVSPCPTVRRHAIAALCAAACVFGFVGRAPAADTEPRVVVLRQNLAPFRQAGRGVKEAIRSSGMRLKLREVVLDGEERGREAAMAEIRAYEPALVVAIGSEATRFSKRAFPNIPIVFAMVLNPVRTGIIPRLTRHGGNVTGAAIDIPFDLQFRKFKEVVPDARRLGVLSNPDQTGGLVAEAKAAAKSLGLTLEVAAVSEPQDVPAALERLLAADVDGLWTVADPTVLNPATTTIILKASLRARLPTMGLSRRHCKAGFLFALAVDYDANGRQAGALAARVISGTAPADIAVAVPEEVQLILNARIAQHIGHTFTPAVLKSATTVFE